LLLYVDELRSCETTEAVLIFLHKDQLITALHGCGDQREC